MGLFDLLKKKISDVVAVPEQSRAENDRPKTFYNMQGNSKTDYATVNFLKMLSYAPHRMPELPDEFPRSLAYDLKIYDPIKRFKEFIKEGYLRKSSTAEVLNTLKVADLKSILDENGVDSKGRKKSDLIERIQSSISPDKLALTEMYSVSDKAIDFIHKNEELLKLFRNPYSVTYEEYIATKNGHEYLSYNDIIWGVFNRREMFSSGNYYDIMRNEYNRAKFLKSENRHVESLRHYIHALFYELNNPRRIMSDFDKERWNGNVEQVPCEILENIFELKSFYMPQMTEECYGFIEPSKILVAKKDFTRMLNDIFDSKQIDVRNYLPEGCR